MSLASKMRGITRNEWLVLSVSAGVCGGVFAAFVVFFAPSLFEQKIGRSEAAFLDIGQGDATLMRFEDGALMLVDCGPDRSVGRALARRLPQWERTISYLVITHPDLDHYGGCIEVLEQYHVEHVVTNGLQSGDEWWQALSASVRAEGAIGHVVTSTAVWQFGATRITFLYPDHDLRTARGFPGAPKKVSDNDTSIVIKVEGAAASLLLTGDAEAPLEQYLVERVGQSVFQTDILKVGHHGSDTSTSLPFLAAVKPHTAVISAGRRNRFGHPHLRVLKRLERAGATVRRTDIEGDVILSF